jgi:hypothetical protein
LRTEYHQKYRPQLKVAPAKLGDIPRYSPRIPPSCHAERKASQVNHANDLPFRHASGRTSAVGHRDGDQDMGEE